MTKNEITFDNLPTAVGYLIEEIREIKDLISRPVDPLPNKNVPIGIDEACRIVGKAKSTIYTSVQKGLIPCCKVGQKLYFYEHELLDWISAGRKKCIAETKADIEMQMQKSVRNKPRNSSLLEY